MLDAGAYGFVICRGGTDMCFVPRSRWKRLDLEQYRISGLTLSKQVLQALVVGVDLATITNEVMAPQLQCINYCYQFEIVCWIVFFMRTQLTRAIRNHFALLH